MVRKKKDNPDIQLYYSLIHGNLKRTKHLVLNEGVSVNHVFMDGSFPLHVAAERGFVEEVTFLLSMKASTDMKNRHGQTPLMLGITYAPIVKALINYKARVNLSDTQWRTALHLATLKVLPDVVRMLIAAGAKTDATDKWRRTPLHVALLSHSQVPSESYLKVVQLLLTNRAPVNWKDRHEATPIFLAVNYGSCAATQMLIDHGAKYDLPSRHNLTPFMVAVLKGYTDLCRLLIKLNCRLDGKYQSNESALRMSVEKGYMDIAALIYASNPNLCDEQWLFVGPASRYTRDPGAIAWLNQITAAPASLRLICRHGLRLVFGAGIKEKVGQLEYPEILKNYILLSDIL